MKSVAGVFASQATAREVLGELQTVGIPPDRIVLLTPGSDAAKIPTTDTEQPGMGKAVGTVVGGAAGIAGGLHAGAVMTAAIPGVGPVLAMGMLGAAVLGAAGATVGRAAGGAYENAMSKGLPADEVFVYEDALRQGRSVVLAFADDDAQAESARGVLRRNGAEDVDSARKQWWIGLRSAEQEEYSRGGGNFARDEDFYRMGFEAALHAQHRCKEYDQVISEMERSIQQLRERYPQQEFEEAYRRGYERGRAYYQSICNKAA